MRELAFTLFGAGAVVLGLLRLFVLPAKLLKQQYLHTLKALNTDVWIRKFTFTDCILCEENNTTTKYAFSDIIKMTEDDCYFYLFPNEDIVLRIHKNNFLVGTADAFREFCNSTILAV